MVYLIISLKKNNYFEYSIVLINQNLKSVVLSDILNNLPLKPNLYFLIYLCNYATQKNTLTFHID